LNEHFVDIIGFLDHSVEALLSYLITDMLLPLIDILGLLDKCQQLALAFIELEGLLCQLLKHQFRCVLLVAFNFIEIALFLVKEDITTDFEDVIRVFDLSLEHAHIAEVSQEYFDVFHQHFVLMGETALVFLHLLLGLLIRLLICLVKEVIVNVLLSSGTRAAVAIASYAI